MIHYDLPVCRSLNVSKQPDSFCYGSAYLVMEQSDPELATHYIIPSALRFLAELTLPLNVYCTVLTMISCT